MNTCKAPGCDKPANCKDLCPTHYARQRKYNSYFLPDPVKINIKNDYAEIEILDVRGNIVARSMIDIDDVDKVKEYKWHLSHGYVNNRAKGKLHRYLLKCPANMVVDHINRNRIDNRKSNLRICTQEENKRNIGKRVNNKSGHIGVSWHTKAGKWAAELTYKGTKYYLGLFKDRLAAAKAYDDKLHSFGDKYSERNL